MNRNAVRLLLMLGLILACLPTAAAQPAVDRFSTPAVRVRSQSIIASYSVQPVFGGWFRAENSRQYTQWYDSHGTHFWRQSRSYFPPHQLLFDERGRVLEGSYQIGGDREGLIARYEYDDQDRRTARLLWWANELHQDAERIEYRYTTDAEGRILAVSEIGHGGAITGKEERSYHSSGALKSIVHYSGSGLGGRLQRDEQYDFDVRGNLLRHSSYIPLTGEIVGASVFSYDLYGRILTASDYDRSGQPTREELWEYDASGQLIRHYSRDDRIGRRSELIHAYDHVGRTKSELQYRNGELIRRESPRYDAWGRLRSKLVEGPDPRSGWSLSHYDYHDDLVIETMHRYSTRDLSDPGFLDDASAFAWSTIVEEIWVLVDEELDSTIEMLRSADRREDWVIERQTRNADGETIEEWTNHQTGDQVRLAEPRLVSDDEVLERVEFSEIDSIEFLQFSRLTGPTRRRYELSLQPSNASAVIETDGHDEFQRAALLVDSETVITFESCSDGTSIAMMDEAGQIIARFSDWETIETDIEITVRNHPVFFRSRTEVEFQDGVHRESRVFHPQGTLRARLVKTYDEHGRLTQRVWSDSHGNQTSATEIRILDDVQRTIEVFTHGLSRSSPEDDRSMGHFYVSDYDLYEVR